MKKIIKTPVASCVRVRNVKGRFAVSDLFDFGEIGYRPKHQKFLNNEEAQGIYAYAVRRIVRDGERLIKEHCNENISNRH